MRKDGTKVAVPISAHNLRRSGREKQELRREIQEWAFNEEADHRFASKPLL